jgi:hypothetical protein
MGHSDASVTLRRYTAFFPKDHDTRREALSKAVTAAEKKTLKQVGQILAASNELDQADPPF